MPTRIQRALAELYDLPLDSDVRDFVCDAETASSLAGEDAVARREVLIVVEDETGTRVGLYLDPAALDAAEDPGSWTDARFAEACLAAEGVSHFVYLSFRAEHAQSVSELELELQAEVDKYALGLLAGQGVGAIRERSRLMRRRLFTEVRFVDEAGSERGERYRAAHELAARYAARLEQEFVDRGDLRALARELRRFYRLGCREKLERIR